MIYCNFLLCKINSYLFSNALLNAYYMPGTKLKIRNTNNRRLYLLSTHSQSSTKENSAMPFDKSIKRCTYSPIPHIYLKNRYLWTNLHVTPRTMGVKKYYSDKRVSGKLKPYYCLFLKHTLFLYKVLGYSLYPSVCVTL